MRRTVQAVIVTVSVLIGILLLFSSCSYDFKDWEFEKYQNSFETVAEIIKSDFETLDEEREIYLLSDDKNIIRIVDTEHIVVIDKDTDALKQVQAFRRFVFDGVNAYDDRLMFIYGGQEYIIYTYDGKKPDYSFLKGLDFYTGKLADGWYVAKLRLR